MYLEQLVHHGTELRTVAADELTTINTKEIVEEYIDRKNGLSGDKITNVQLNVIKTMCDRLGIDMKAFINSGNRTYNTPEEIPKETAVRMIQRLNEYQSSEKSIEIPEELKVKENEDES